MNIEYYCPLWGRAEQPFAAFCSDVKAAGYDGVELPFPMLKDKRDGMVRILKDSGLKYIAQHWETFEPDFSKHLKEYESRLYNLAEVNPEFISSQTGRDWFSFEQNLEILSLAQDVALKTEVIILHETHRSKMLYAAHVTKRFLEKLPSLRLTLDISHWCTVAETLLEDQEDAVALALSRTDHIHARIGFAQGPQVSDPGAPEWKETMNRYLSWWTMIIQRGREEGKERMTITSEFGPYPYMTHLPFTREPIADQWQINIDMKDRLKSLFMNS